VGIVGWVDRCALGSGLIALLVLSLPLTAVAQGAARSPAISTRVDPCVPVDLEQFHRVLAIELGTSIEYSADANARHGPTTVWLSCTNEGIELHLEDALTRKSMRRVVELARVPQASRSRLLALAVAEFVVASWIELHLNETPALRRVGPPVSGSAQLAASRIAQAHMPQGTDTERVFDWRLSLGFQLQAFLNAPYPLVPGVDVQLVQRPTRAAVLGLAVQFGHRDLGARNDGQTFGDIRLTTASALLSASYSARIADLELSAGLGGRVGLLQMAGRTGQVGIKAWSFYDIWGGPALVLGAAYRADSRLSLVAEFEGGLVLRPVHVLFHDVEQSSQRVLLRIDRGWVSVLLGVGWSF
jgi:hypothetical protein